MTGIDYKLVKVPWDHPDADPLADIRRVIDEAPIRHAIVEAARRQQLEDWEKVEAACLAMLLDPEKGGVLVVKSVVGRVVRAEVSHLVPPRKVYFVTETGGTDPWATLSFGLHLA